MKCIKIILILSLFFASALFSDDDPAKVLVVYNTSFPDNNGNGIGDSQEAAEYYAAKRGVPSGNILSVSTSTSTYYYHETGRVDMLDNLVTPILNKLSELGEDNIYYILLSYGIPEKYVCEGLDHYNRGIDNALCMIHSLGNLDSTTWPLYWISNYSYFESSPTVGGDVGHFTGTENYAGERIFLVTRLDGINVERSKELVDRALYGEKYLYSDSGYYGGTVYVDYRWGPYTDLSGYPFSYYTYAGGDSAMAKGSEFVLATEWTLREEPYGTEIGEDGATYLDGTDATSAPSAIGYEGWYNYGTYHDVWEWKVGAFACDLNSNSGANMRNGTGTFLSSAFRLGLTCGVGCVAEPYMNGHARPEVFLYYMLNGFNFAEASYLSQPAFKWQGIHIGDPLFNPHKPKTPVFDTIPPPVPTVEVSWSGDSLRLGISINTFGREPDLVKTRICYGEHSSTLADTIDYGRVFCMWEQFAIGGFSVGDTIDILVDVIDPVGNHASTPLYSWVIGDEGELGIEEISSLPHNAAISIAPNPFNSSCAITAPTNADVEIYDLRGNVVGSRLASTDIAADTETGDASIAPTRTFIWTPDKSIASGVYLIRATMNDGRTTTKRVILIK